MAWTECQYSKGAIDEAGKKLVMLAAGHPMRNEALEVINNWRSCHSYPLHIVAKTLQSRARLKIHPNALVARRIKRLPSIALKLKHNRNMQLSQMQDIGGCRAVLRNVGEIERLVAVYAEALAKHPNPSDRPFVGKMNDYIKNPKPDGYRGVHLIMKFQSKSKTAYNGQRVEIQIRSQLQHAWATAVETCQAFTGQALKSKIKSASDSWIRFFALMSTAIAIRERRPTVPGTPHVKRQLKAELKELQHDLQVLTMLAGWKAAIHHPFIADNQDSKVYLLELNTVRRRLSVTPYGEDEVFAAHVKYLDREKETEDDPSIQVVLVSADSVANLKRAYPNFYVDTTAFIRAVEQETY